MSTKLALFLGVVILLLSSTVRAERPRWELGPELEPKPGWRTVALGDGRLLTCSSYLSGSSCELVDPLTAERRAAVVGDPQALENAIALSDGQLLLTRTEQLLDPESGVTRVLPPAGRSLASLRGIPLSGGRAALVSPPSSSSPPDASRLLLFLGLDRGFRELSAGPPGTSVSAVFDLEDGRLLVAREVFRQGDRRDLELLLLRTEDFTWQRGVSFPFRAPLAAYRKGDDIVVLLGTTRVEVLTVDAAGGNPRFSKLGRENAYFTAAHRMDDGRVMLFGPRPRTVLWDASSTRLVEPPWPAPKPGEPVVAKRSGRLAVVSAGGGRVFVWSPDPAPYATPCDAAFRYAEVVLAKPSGYVNAEEFEALLRLPGAANCVEHLERQRKLPDFLQLPLEALAARTSGPTTNTEQAAAQFVCILSPTFAASLITRVTRPELLHPAYDQCREAGEKIPVLAAARAPRNVPVALVRAGIDRSPVRRTVKWWVVPLLRERPDIARQSSRLLLAAAEQPARGFDQLRDSLCRPPTRELRDACERTSGTREGDVDRANKRRTALVRLGVATGAIGGLGALAYVGRNDGLGRGVAIGSGIAAGGGLAAVVTILATDKGGALDGAFGILLAIPMTALGAVGGGFLSAKLSEKPGMSRFAVSAVPLSAALLTTGMLTIPDF